MRSGATEAQGHGEGMMEGLLSGYTYPDMPGLVVRAMAEGDVPWLEAGFRRMGWAKSEGYFDRCAAAQARGEQLVLVAQLGEEYLGHTKVVWVPEYPPLREQGIPEIQDLNVIPAYRRRGVATRLLDVAEALIATRSDRAGIGVGLHPGYNAAIRLYGLRGYVPDGRGVTYHDHFVSEGEAVRMDDDLILHLVKPLR